MIPIVLNVINDARKGAFEATAMGLLKTAENECLAEMLKGTGLIKEVEFNDWQITSEDELAFSGRGAKGGDIHVNAQCKIAMAIHNGDWCITKEYDSDEIVTTPYDGECGLGESFVFSCDNEGYPCLQWEGNPSWGTVIQDAGVQEIETRVATGDEIEIHNWHDLRAIDANEENLNKEYILMADLNSDSPGYEEYVSNPSDGWDPISDITLEYIVDVSSATGGGFVLSGYCENSDNNFEVGPIDYDINQEGLDNLFGWNQEYWDEVKFSTYEVIEEGRYRFVFSGPGGGIKPFDAELTVDDQTLNGEANIEHKPPFTGSFDGNGYTIDALIIDKSNLDGIGLFGLVKDAEFINVALSNININGNDHVSGLIGYGSGDVDIVNSYIEGEVVGNEEVGGIIGFLREGNINLENSYFAGNVLGDSEVGGIIGFSRDSNVSIENSYFTGDIAADDECVGGLIGYADTGKVEIENSYVEGDILASGSYIGGLVGYIYEDEAENRAQITNSYFEGNITGEHLIGGLIGFYFNWQEPLQDAQIINSYVKGNLQGEYSVGGLIAQSFRDIKITNSYFEGEVLGGFNVGGLVGESYKNLEIEETYIKADVFANNDVGGIIGYIDSLVDIIITNSYGKINVTGLSGTVGGLTPIMLHDVNYLQITNFYLVSDITGGDDSGVIIGIVYSEPNITINSSFFNGDINENLDAVGTGESVNFINSNTEDMLIKNTYEEEGWDFEEIWQIE